jgi:hypothetical protein
VNRIYILPPFFEAIKLDMLSRKLPFVDVQIENVLSNSIKILHTDGGTKFKLIARSFPSITYLFFLLILVAERHHRYVVELSLAIMSHAHLHIFSFFFQFTNLVSYF